ncbi:MAG: acriflavine resistance protein B, partial [Magnetovibrio sp.]|nr:acriflavine resistance protein B [Magnetovibrio sp.]
MNLSELCIRRPVMTTLVMLGLVLFGVFAYRGLPVSELPNVDYPTIEVTATLPGANPETMAAAVATTLEGQFSRIAGVRNMTSISASGTSRITLEFELNRNIDAAALDVQSAISTALRSLPDDMTDPPSFRKINPADFAIFYIGLSSDTLPISMVNEFAETMLAQQLSTINGVAQVQIWGQQKFAVRAQVDPDALATRGIAIGEVEQAIRGGNSYQPTGTLNGPDRAIAVKTTGQMSNAAAYNKLIVAYRNGAPVRLSEIGTAIDGVEATRVATYFGERQGIMLAVYRQPGSNTVQIVKQINDILPVFRQQLPESVNLEVMYDRAQSIEEAILDVEFTLMLASALVVLVIFLFLRNLAATVIASIALPISVIGTFSIMYVMGFSLNNLSLLALTLSVGFVVDDAIVMLENIIRHKEKGLSSMQAALKGSREIGFTILSMTLSLVAVFIPVMFMGGMVGRLLHEFAMTISVTIIVSGIVSLMLTPMMCSRWISDAAHGAEKPTRGFMAMTERAFDAMLHAYDLSLLWCLKRKPFVLAVFLGTLVGTWGLYSVIQKDFLPAEDTGRLIIYTEGGQDVSFDAMRRYQKEVADIVNKDPNVAATMSRVGAAGSRITNNAGLLFLRLKPRHARPDADINDVVQNLRRKLNKVAGIKSFVRNPPAIRVGGRLSNAQYQYTLQDLDLESLYKWAEIMAEELGKLPGFQDVTTDLKIRSPSLVVDIDRDRAGTMGIKAEEIEAVLANAFGGRKVSTIYTAANQYAVILEVAPEFQQDPEALKKLYIRAPGDRLVPLAAVATLTRGVSPLTISHQGQIPAVTISFNLAPEVSLGTAIDRVHALERAIQVPATLTTSFQGTAKVFQESLAGMGMLLALAIIVVYIVLGILYESFIHPLTILSGLPAAGGGALLALMAFDMPLTLYGFVGIIMLVGIVKKNAIMMIDFALSAQRE